MFGRRGRGMSRVYVDFPPSSVTVELEKMTLITALLLSLALTASTFPTKMHHMGDEDSWVHPRFFDHSSPRDGSSFFSPEQNADYWYRIARAQLHETLTNEPILTRAKSTIMFMGDGMSIPTITAARIYNGQLNGVNGEGYSIFFDKFPYVGLSKTYSVSNQVADSASTATAYLGGVKTNSGMLGLTGAVTRGDCIASLDENKHVPSIFKWAQDAGLSTGVVTTTRVTHASPGAAYAHVAEREWESDADVVADKANPGVCQDIAQQLVYGETGSRLNVIMGGGRRNFLPNDTKDEDGKRGKRLDGKNLISEWLVQKSMHGHIASYVSNRRDLMAVDVHKTDYLLGLFDSSNMNYHLESDPSKEPTLAEMTTVAINILRKNTKGYFLFVEGGRIDHGHHLSRAHVALDETIQMAEAVRLTSSVTSEKETLIVVTADHAHTMSISGYALRGNPIFGLAGKSKVDGLYYSILSYANGPGYKRPIKPHCQRYDITGEDLGDIRFKFPAAVPLGSETHGGDDVAVYAKGPWAHLFTGNYEQNYIMHAMCYAIGIGPASEWGEAPLSTPRGGMIRQTT